MPEEAVLETPVETPPAPAAPATPPTPERKSFKEAEAEFNAKNGVANSKIDVTKLRGYKAPEPVTPKPKEKTPAAAPAPGQPITEEEKKARVTRNQRRFGKLEAKIRELSSLVESQATQLKGNPAPQPIPTSKPATAKEPERKDYATVEEWVAAVRKFDREQIEGTLAKTKTEAEQQKVEQETDEIVRDYNSRLSTARSKHEDWDELMESTDVEFVPVLQGLLITADPEILYEFASNPRQAKAINRLTENSAAAVGTADDITAVLRYVSKNPKLIDELNELSPTKAAKFVGRMEVAIEIESKAAGKTPSKEAPTPETPKPSGPQAAQPIKADQPKPAEPQREPAPKPKPEPPPVISGAPPKSSDWKSPEAMSLKERERLMMEDPQYGKKHSNR